MDIAPYLIIQAVIGFAMLETVNYVEHYGLLRQRLPNGRYEKCAPRHSWNSDRLVTNVFLFHLQRHSDHHANPSRRYQTLRSFDEAPQLPAGYATMIVCAMIPPLWRRVMDHGVLAHYDGDITRANIAPRLRDEILSTYAPTTEEGHRALRLVDGHADSDVVKPPSGVWNSGRHARFPSHRRAG